MTLTIFYEYGEPRYKGEIKTIILIFSVTKSQNSNKEEKNSITAKAYSEIASCYEFLAAVTFNNESPLLTRFGLTSGLFASFFARAKLMLKTPPVM